MNLCLFIDFFFFFKQKTAYEMSLRDWSSDVCSSDLRKVRGLSGLGAIARAVAVDRLDVGFVDILPCEGCLDHPLLGPRDELFRRRQIVGATEPAPPRSPVVEEAVARGVKVGEAFF